MLIKNGFPRRLIREWCPFICKAQTHCAHPSNRRLVLSPILVRSINRSLADIEA